MRNITGVQCDCENWETFVEELISSIQFSSMHGVKCDNYNITHCPLCGKVLTPK